MDAIVLRGRTVTLRLLSLADATALATAASESRDQYVYTRVPDGVEDAKRYIEMALADHEIGRRIPFAIIWHDRIVGSTSSRRSAMALASPISAPANRSPRCGGDRRHLARRVGSAHAVQHRGEAPAALPRLRRLAGASCLAEDGRAQDARRCAGPMTIRRTLFVLAVPDLSRSSAFYRDVLGFEIREMEDPGWRMFVRDGCRIMAGECPDALP